jgi:hypothetical protein
MPPVIFNSWMFGVQHRIASKAHARSISRQVHVGRIMEKPAVRLALAIRRLKGFDTPRPRVAGPPGETTAPHPPEHLAPGHPDPFPGCADIVPCSGRSQIPQHLEMMPPSHPPSRIVSAAEQGSGPSFAASNRSLGGPIRDQGTTRDP